VVCKVFSVRWTPRIIRFSPANLITTALIVLWVGPAAAQNLSIDIGGESLSFRTVQLFVLLTVLSLAPGLAIMLTCFPFMVTVLSILRQAIGVQQAPPNMMIISLAMFLTWFAVEPVFTQAWETGIEPLMQERISPEESFQLSIAPFRVFMESRVSTEILSMMIDISPTHVAADQDIPLSILLPSFLLGEIQRGFEVGFLIFLLFLLIDLIIAAVLMSMGMMMVPPAVVSLPFKLAFFVIADGWTLLAGALVRSYSG
jgi:flagellar biosynthetic protein FliP